MNLRQLVYQIYSDNYYTMLEESSWTFLNLEMAQDGWMKWIRKRFEIPRAQISILALAWGGGNKGQGCVPDGHQEKVIPLLRSLFHLISYKIISSENEKTPRPFSFSSCTSSLFRCSINYQFISHLVLTRSIGLDLIGPSGMDKSLLCPSFRLQKKNKLTLQINFNVNSSSKFVLFDN